MLTLLWNDNEAENSTIMNNHWIFDDCYLVFCKSVLDYWQLLMCTKITHREVFTKMILQTTFKQNSIFRMIDM